MVKTRNRFSTGTKMESTEGVADMIQPYLMESTEGVADLWTKARLPKAVGSDQSPRLLGFPPRES